MCSHRSIAIPRSIQLAMVEVNITLRHVITISCEHVVQTLLNLCFFGVYFEIHTKAHITQIKVSI